MYCKKKCKANHSIEKIKRKRKVNEKAENKQTNKK